jgi:capsular polysaccharide transport system permease protein
MDLVAIFRRPEADLWARLWYPEPETERLVDYYRSMVSAYVDSASGITTLAVRSFRPQDSLAMNRALLAQGEALVNRLNQRIVADTVEGARRELARAELRVAGATQAISEFRERERQLDPSRLASIAVETIGRLEGQLATARGELQALQGFARPNSPQVQSLQNRINALQAQVAEERRRTSTLGGEGFTEQVAAYERLRLEAEFGGRQLTAATANLERAMSDAQRQQLFLQRVVEPNLAERYRYPKRFTSALYVFIGLSVVYGLVWLIVAGVKEHAA